VSAVIRDLLKRFFDWLAAAGLRGENRDDE
jgi:hypothetical protein